MNLKLLYGLVYGFFGFIVAALAAAFVYGLTSALLWNFVIGDGAWPPWLLLLLAFLFIGVFLTVNIKLIMVGLKKGQLLAEEDEAYQKENYQKAKWLLQLSVVSLLILISFLTFRFGSFGSSEGTSTQAKPLFQSSQPQLQQVFLRQKDETLEIVVGVTGKAATSETYHLQIDVIAQGNQTRRLMDFQQDLPLKYDQQQFVFPLAFETLGQKFNEYFSQYVPRSDEKIGIDAMIKIEARLQKLGSGEEQAVSLGAMSVLARFFFSCKNDLCIVSQFDDVEDIPTEKIKNSPPAQ
jgi:hypothetical protein